MMIAPGLGYVRSKSAVKSFKVLMKTSVAPWLMTKAQKVDPETIFETDKILCSGYEHRIQNQFAPLFPSHNIKIMASVSRIILSNKIIKPNALDTANKSSKMNYWCTQVPELFSAPPKSTPTLQLIINYS